MIKSDQNHSLCNTIFHPSKKFLESSSKKKLLGRNKYVRSIFYQFLLLVLLLFFNLEIKRITVIFPYTVTDKEEKGNKNFIAGYLLWQAKEFDIPHINTKSQNFSCIAEGFMLKRIDSNNF